MPAKLTRITHFVYNSVGASIRPDRNNQLESKLRIKEHLRSTAMRHTILRPVF